MQGTGGVGLQEQLRHVYAPAGPLAWYGLVGARPAGGSGEVLLVLLEAGARPGSLAAWFPTPTPAVHPPPPPPSQPCPQVKTAKNHTPGFVVHPVCMAPTSTVAELYDLKERKGFTSVCVTGGASG